MELQQYTQDELHDDLRVLLEEELYDQHYNFGTFVWIVEIDGNRGLQHILNPSLSGHNPPMGVPIAYIDFEELFDEDDELDEDVFRDRVLPQTVKALSIPEE